MINRQQKRRLFKLKLRKRRILALSKAEENAQNPDFKKLWADKKAELLNKPL